ncbi:hypothetical protein [Singulisphaera acidiphila]|uniref:PEP-CTERM sorting domain-containing protein n=1 Tax=Singulisphaera acidiphila (strain ATCC BAA-1392 / DSM 18658 / VKM B-2454 / MOB10) TaxID=886293 RepID=L0DGG6_SINAD|nr:hypothetical protein [Singulisphaera acidiphila]AGA27940.1 hypothetical protein Sinac_3698 [Singulisphaera acidiphila DSM 18658]
MRTLRKAFLAASLAATLSLASTTAWAQGFVPGAALVNPGLSGTTEYDGWVGLTSGNYSGYPGFPGTGSWFAPLAPNQTGSGSAGVFKVSDGSGGGPFPASGSMYFGSFSATINAYGGTLAVADSTPVTGVKNVVLQIQIGEAWTYDFFGRALPTLSYNGGTQALAATSSVVLDRYYNGTVEMPSGLEDVYINTYLIQWDLSSLPSVTSFSISFDGVEHAQLYALQLDQSDEYAPAEIPGLNANGSRSFVLRKSSVLGTQAKPAKDRKAYRGAGRTRQPVVTSKAVTQRTPGS